jgi:hypothetical protein
LLEPYVERSPVQAEQCEEDPNAVKQIWLILECLEIKQWTLHPLYLARLAERYDDE